MANKPSGTVTFLFSDIEGSTRRWEKNADLMQAAFSRHESILRETMDDHGGYVYKMIGDAFQVAFNTAHEALNSALAAQKSLQDEEWGEIGPIKVRMALHTGVVEERTQDYVGPVLNRAARLMSSAHGGQVLLSQVTFELLRDIIPTGITIIDLGEHRLKDLDRPERIYQLTAPGLATSFPPLITLDAFPNNLPQQLTSFIGREREIEKIKQLLETNRLITLCGPGGSGKTRLALQVAANAFYKFEHGIFFIDLAPISDPQFVSRTIAETLSIRDATNQPMVQSIKNFLGEKYLLLIFDNYEQIIETAPLVSELLSSAPEIKILVTSRQPLRISGEQEYHVPPMKVPSREPTARVKNISQYEAVELFINRAKSVRPDFEITDANATMIGEICSHLDGLPLAIELAAARIRILSPHQLLNRLQTRFKELIAGMRDKPDRQQTLLATIEWSYDLLEELEKELFARLSVFQGGRTIEAAEAVCGPGLPLDVLDGMESLTRQSLMFVEQGLDSAPRFMMLETIHEFSRQKLIEFRNEKESKEQHADYYLALVERAEPEMHGSRQAHWSAKLRSEHDNLRAALSWSFSDGDYEVGIRLVGALRDYWYYQGLFGEGWKWTEIALKRIDDAPATVQAKLYYTASNLSFFYHGDHQRGVEWATKALNIYRDLDNEHGMAWAHIYLGANLLGFPNRIKEGIFHCEEALALFRKLDHLPGTERALNMLGESTRMDNDYEQAVPAYEEALRISREVGNKYRVALSLLNIAYVYNHRGDYHKEEEVIKEALALRRDNQSKYFIAMCLDALASPLTATGEPERAAKLLGASQKILNSMGVNRQVTEQVEIDRILASIHDQLDEPKFEQAWQEGQAMTSEQATSFALGEEHREKSGK